MDTNCCSFGTIKRTVLGLMASASLNKMLLLPSILADSMKALHSTAAHPVLDVMLKVLSKVPVQRRNQTRKTSISSMKTIFTIPSPRLRLAETSEAPKDWTWDGTTF